MTSEEQSEASSEPKDPLARIAKRMTKLKPGEHARLRRIYLKQNAMSHGVVAKLLFDAGLSLERSLQSYANWQLIIHVAAMLSGTGRLDPHSPHRSVGSAVSEAGLSESRLLRLTAARDEALRDQIVLVTRRVAQAGKGPINLWTLFDLVSSNPDKAEKARLQIARDYYATGNQPEGEDN